MDIPNIYTVEEVAGLLKTDIQVVTKEIEVGRLEAFKIGTEWRVTGTSIADFIKNGGSLAGEDTTGKLPYSNLQLQKTLAFSYTWPDRSIEEYSEAYEGTVNVDSKQVLVKLGIGKREATGRNRKRVVIFLDDRPTVEFVGVDDFSESKKIVSVVTLPNRKRLKPRQTVPSEYRSFDLVRYNTVVTGPRAMSVMAVITNIDDLNTMVSHAITRALYRDQI